MEWKSLFKSESALLRETIGDYVVAVEHIGSTAIFGLEAKPIIDILVGVQKAEDAEKCVTPLAQIGYEYRGQQGIAGRFYFRKGTGEVSTHHLNIAETTSDFWRTHLFFRDYLRQHRDAAQEYGKLKRALAEKYKGKSSGIHRSESSFYRERFTKGGRI